MVGEFSELQGIMGREYALLNGEKQETAQAIYEHYLPRFAGDALPKSAAGRILSIADKTDNLAAAFSRGLIPTGSQDPYALRRQALGIVHILLDAKYNISLTGLMEAAWDFFKIDEPQKRRELTAAIADFFRLRLKNVLADQNIRYDIIDAVLAAETDDIYDANLRAEALARFITEGETNAVQKTLQALTRVNNLAKQAKAQSAKIDVSLFEQEVEKKLYQAYSGAAGKIKQAANEKNYLAAFNELFSLTKPIDDFFETVMVMVDDMAIRQNRLALLSGITCLASPIADLSKIV
jgi:glycyl-tRNA synthetase beta chain